MILLNKVVGEYDNCYHDAIKMTALEVSKNSETLLWIQYV